MTPSLRFGGPPPSQCKVMRHPAALPGRGGLRNPTRCFAHVGTGGCKVTEPGLALFAALSVGSSPLDLPLAGRNGGVRHVHSLGAPRPCGRAGAEQQRVPGGSGAGRVLVTSTASRVACRYFFSPCYSFQGPSSREEHPLGCVLTVQSRERRGLAENVSGDHLSFHGGVQVAILIPSKAGGGQLGTSLERPWHAGRKREGTRCSQRWTQGPAAFPSGGQLLIIKSRVKDASSRVAQRPPHGGAAGVLREVSHRTPECPRAERPDLSRHQSVLSHGALGPSPLEQTFSKCLQST